MACPPALRHALAAVMAAGATLAGACAAGAGHAAAREPDTPCAVTVSAPEPPRPTEEQAAYRRRLHSFATGADVRVAVIDTGVSPHPQLERLVAGRDLVTPQEPDPLRDCDAHGTAVAGIIAGRDIGLAPRAEIYAIRQTSAHYRHVAEPEAPAAANADEARSAGTLETLAAAIDDAVAARARVINISVVACVPPELSARLDTSNLDAALARAEEAGTVVVVAAGNATSGGCGHDSVVYPAHSATVLAVGARADAHRLADYSIRSAGPELSADGHAPVVLDAAGGWSTAKQVDDEGAEFHGTSFAAPVVSATVALLAERYPDATPAQLRDRVLLAAEPSFGFLDPLAALTQVEAPYRVTERTLRLRPAPSEPSGARRRLGTLAAGNALLLLALVIATTRRGPAPRSKGLAHCVDPARRRSIGGFERLLAAQRRAGRQQAHEAPRHAAARLDAQ